VILKFIIVICLLFGAYHLEFKLVGAAVRLWRRTCDFPALRDAMNRVVIQWIDHDSIS